MKRFQTSESSGASLRDLLAPEESDHIDSVVLAAGALYRHPVPDGAKVVVLSFDGGFWARFGDADDTVSVPNASGTNGRGGEFSPSARRITLGATHILLIAEAACKGSLAFYG